MPKIKSIVSIIEEWLSPLNIIEGDKVGLQIGSTQKEITKILIALDLRPEVIKEAKDLGAGLIVTHHPLIYNSLEKIIREDSIGDLITQLIREDLALYVAHTNFDQAKKGVNWTGAKVLGLTNCQPLLIPEEEQFKFVVYIPIENIDDVSKAVFQAGAGQIGQYSGCSFRTVGEGTFIPSDQSKPALGKKGELNKVKEVRLEVDVEKSKLSELIKKVIEVHPYEEVAYNAYSVKKYNCSNGLGIIGNLKESCSLSELVSKVKSGFEIQTVKLVGDQEKEIKKVAFCGGSGGRLIEQAFQKKAEVYITGDISYHQALTAQSLGLIIIDIGHNPSEIKSLPTMKENLGKMFQEEDLDVTIELSKNDKDVWRHL